MSDWSAGAGANGVATSSNANGVSNFQNFLQANGGAHSGFPFTWDRAGYRDARNDWRQDRPERGGFADIHQFITAIRSWIDSRPRPWSFGGQNPGGPPAPGTPPGAPPTTGEGLGSPNWMGAPLFPGGRPTQVGPPNAGAPYGAPGAPGMPPVGGLPPGMGMPPVRPLDQGAWNQNRFPPVNRTY